MNLRGVWLIQPHSKASYHPSEERDCDLRCYAIPVAQVTFLVARDALKTVGIMPKSLYEFNDLLQGVIKHLIRVLNRILNCHCCATYRPNT